MRAPCIECSNLFDTRANICEYDGLWRAEEPHGYMLTYMQLLKRSEILAGTGLASFTI